jgi:Ca-activated chloride channel homolog
VHEGNDSWPELVASERRQGGQGKHAQSRRPRLWAGAAVLAALVVLIPFAVYRITAGPPGNGCATATVVHIQADPRIAGVLSAAMKDFGLGKECVYAQVDLRNSADLAFDVSRPVSQTSAIPLPDVWVPDSSLWLARARTFAADTGSTDGDGRLSQPTQSLVRTPVVIAVRKATATSLGWPQRKQNWQDLASRGNLKVALTGPVRDAAALATALGQQLAGGKGATAPTDRLISFTRQVSLPALHGASPTSAVQRGTVDAIDTTEQEVVAENAREPQKPLVAYYDPATTITLDFPFVPLAAAATGRVPAALQHADDVVLLRMLSPQAQARFAAAGFRTGSGNLGAGVGPQQGVLPVALPTPPQVPDQTLQMVQTSWADVAKRGRILLVMDESGSMADPLPGSPLSKMDLAKQAVAAVVRQVAPDSELGLWTFTASRRKDYVERVALGRLDDRVRGQLRRDALTAAVAKMRPVPNGNTGLYDTTLAAFRQTAEAYTFGQLNAVLLLTDGRNDLDPGGISLGALLATLGKDFDKSRPVRIITFAYGKDADGPTLARIAQVTDGKSYSTVRPDQVGSRLTDVLEQR